MSDENMLGPYRLLRKLGEGGMGTVYLGHDDALERAVAIKVLRLQEHVAAGMRAAMTKRFMREARSVARLNHPQVVTVYGAGQVDGNPPRPYLVMEYVAGGSLADQLRADGPLGWRAATEAVRDALLGLEAAHTAGVIHRDIKPANLMRGRDGGIKLVDFGLARVARDAALEGELTFPGAFVGSPSYASPEQAGGALLLDGRSDLYSLAATWYTLIVGQPPFVEDDPAEVMRRHLTERFPDLREFAAVPTGLLVVMERASRHEAGDRHQSAAEMRREVERLLAEPQGVATGAARRGAAGRFSVEETVTRLEEQLELARAKLDSGTQLAALRSLYGLYTQLERRDDATKVFREALVLHVQIHAPGAGFN